MSLLKPAKPLVARVKPQARYNRNAVVQPMASIRNTCLTSSEFDDIEFLDETDRETAGFGTTVDRFITGSISSSMEMSAVLSLLMEASQD